MKVWRVKYSDIELAWIKENSHLTRAELHARFCKKFGRGEITVDHIKGLCTRKGWLNSAPRQRRVFSQEEECWVSENYTRPRKAMHRDFCSRFCRTDIDVTHLNALCTRNRWISRPSRPPIKYSTEELAWVKANCTLPHAQLHAKFTKRFDRADVKMDDIKSLCTRKGWKTGRTGQYSKGNVPDNKGKKMPFNANSAKTQFKKGQCPHNTKHLGHERTDKDGYIHISVKETNPHTGYERRYVHKHRYLWEQKHGPIPEGMVLKCLDADKSNTDPSNWKLIPRGILPRLSRWRDYDNAPAELKPTILATAEVEHQTNELRKQQNG